jgi:hypothetical protein
LYSGINLAKNNMTYFFISDKFPNFHLNIFALDIFTRWYLGIFIQRLNPRAKALGPNQNKNAQIQLAKLSKQKVFVKLNNWSDKKIRDCHFTFDKTFILSMRQESMFLYSAQSHNTYLLCLHWIWTIVDL